jgi:hypothetical protein
VIAYRATLDIPRELVQFTARLLPPSAVAAAPVPVGSDRWPVDLFDAKYIG